MKGIPYTLGLLLFCMTIVTLLSGQPHFSKNTVISAGQGIEGLEVHKLFMDHEQRLWIKTELALNIHDGTEVKVLKKGTNEYNLHSSNGISNFADRGEFVDIYYNNEWSFFDRWHKNSGSVDSVSLDVPLPQDTIVQFLLSNNKDLWLLRKSETHYYFFNTHNQQSIHSSYLQIRDDFGIQKVSTGKNGFWLMDKRFNCYFFSYSDTQNQVKYLRPKQLISHKKTIQQLDHILQEDSLGDLWVSFPGIKGIFCKSTSDSQLKQVNELPDDGLYVFMWQDQKGRILYGLSQRYRYIDAFYLRDSQGKIEHWKELNDFTNIPTQIYSHDFYDYLFLGTYRELQILEFRKPFMSVYHDKKMVRPQGKYGNIIRGAVETNDGSLYIMEDNDDWLKITNEYIQKVTFEKGGTYNYFIKYAPKTNTIYAYTRKEIIKTDGTRSYAPPRLLAIDPETDTFEHIDIGRTIYHYAITPNNELFLIYRDSLKNFQVGRYQLDTKHLSPILTIEKKKEKLYSQEIVYDENNHRIWLLFRFQGLFYIDLNESPTVLKHFDIGLSGRRIRHNNLNLGQANDLWVSTAEGAVLIDTKQQKTTRLINKENGLKDEFICGVISRDSVAWMSTYYGLYAYNLVTNNLVSIFEGDGIPMNEFNGKAVTERIDGPLFFGSANGLVRINPEKFHDYGEHFEIHLRQISFGISGDKRQTIYTHPSEGIEIQYSDQQVLKVVVGNSYWGDHTAANYQYFIEGIDQKWQQLSHDNTIEYDRLPIGKYTLQIKGLSPIGFPSKNELLINIETIAPFYKKIGFIIFTISSLIGTLIFFATKRYYFSKQQQENQKLKYENRISQLELLALQSQMNPHFIFNALNAIQEYLWQNDKEFVERYLNDFAKLTRLYLESSKVKVITLEQEIELLRLYTSLEKLRFKDKIDVNIEISKNIEPKYFKIPTMLIQPFVENAINHGLFHKINKGTINIIIFEKAENVHIIVQDDGIGRDAASKIKRESLNNYKSRALQITEERINVLKTHENVLIDIKVDDLFDNNQKSIGTKVEIIIPEMF